MIEPEDDEEELVHLPDRYSRLCLIYVYVSYLNFNVLYCCYY
jgi:hypothetical protein